MAEFVLIDDKKKKGSAKSEKASGTIVGEKKRGEGKKGGRKRWEGDFFHNTTTSKCISNVKSNVLLTLVLSQAPNSEKKSSLVCTLTIAGVVVERWAEESFWISAGGGGSLSICISNLVGGGNS